MCNHYASSPEIRQELSTWREFIGWSLKVPLPPELAELEDDIWPRREAAVVRSTADAEGAFADIMRWGVPLTLPGKTPGKVITKHVTNVRNLESPFWRNMLARPEHRCLVPFTRFAEPKAGQGRQEHWFHLPSQPLAAFAGVWRMTAEAKSKPVPAEHIEAPLARPSTGPGLAEEESSQRKVFAFLTCEPNPLVAPLHSKAMPVILHPQDYQRWLSAGWAEACKLVQPFPSQLMAVE